MNPININDTVKFKVKYFEGHLNYKGKVVDIKGNLATIEYDDVNVNTYEGMTLKTQIYLKDLSK